MSRLAQSIIRHPWRVIAAWLVLLVAAMPLAGKLLDRTSNGGYTVAGSESARLASVMQRHFAQGGRSSLVALVHTDGRDPASLRAASSSLRARLSRLRIVHATEPPVIARTGRDALVGVELRS